jgi:hypothetical protein
MKEFLRRLNSGRSDPKFDAWRELAIRSNGRVLTGRGDRVKRADIPIEPWWIALDIRTESSGESSHVLTRMRAVYRSTDDFRFRVYRRSFFSGLATFFGMQDIEVGQPDIDADWIIKSNSTGRIQSLLALPKITKTLASLRAGRLEVKPLRGRGKPPGHMVLTYETPGIVRELSRLESGVELMRHVLDRMARLGSAARETPTADL